MLIRTYGFSLEAGNSAVTLNDLFTELQAQSGKTIPGMAHPRIFFFDNSDPSFAKGLVVTLKDHKTYCQLVNDQGKLVIKVSAVNDQLLDFNFFIVNKSNGFGLYQYYHHSCAPGTFGGHLRQVYRSICSARTKSELQKLSEDGKGTKKAEAKVRSKYFKSLKFQILVHLSSIDKILKEFKKIKAFQYEVTALTHATSAGAPLGPYAKKVVEKVYFDGESKVGDVAKAIGEYITSENISKGSIDVIDVYGNEDIPMSVRIGNIPNSFGEEDFDSFTAHINDLDASQFASHVIINRLVDKAKNEHKAIFMKKIKGQN